MCQFVRECVGGVGDCMYLRVSLSVSMITWIVIYSEVS